MNNQQQMTEQELHDTIVFNYNQMIYWINESSKALTVTYYNECLKNYDYYFKLYKKYLTQRLETI